jgi:hypothetical protein
MTRDEKQSTGRQYLAAILGLDPEPYHPEAPDVSWWRAFWTALAGQAGAASDSARRAPQMSAEANPPNPPAAPDAAGSEESAERKPPATADDSATRPTAGATKATPSQPARRRWSIRGSVGTSARAAAMRRYLGSRKNIAGIAGALAGVGLHLAGVIGNIWPVVVVGLYGVGALIGPREPSREPRLTDTLRSQASALRARVEAQADALPLGTVAEVVRIVGDVRLVLDHVDQLADHEVDRIAAPEQLVAATEILLVDLPACLDTYLGRAPSTPQEPAALELESQLRLVVARADRLVAQVPDVHLQLTVQLPDDLALIRALRRWWRRGE